MSYADVLVLDEVKLRYESCGRHTAHANQRSPFYLYFQEVEIVGCKFLNTLVNYFVVCTYFWMLCEGENCIIS